VACSPLSGGSELSGQYSTTAIAAIRQYIPLMHFLEGYERSTIVPICPSAFAAFVESDNYFALRCARQKSAAIVGCDSLSGIVALAAN
jgi:hypothetical protein